MLCGNQLRLRILRNSLSISPKNQPNMAISEEPNHNHRFNPLLNVLSYSIAVAITDILQNQSSSRFQASSPNCPLTRSKFRSHISMNPALSIDPMNNRSRFSSAMLNLKMIVVPPARAKQACAIDANHRRGTAAKTKGATRDTIGILFQRKG